MQFGRFAQNPFIPLLVVATVVSALVLFVTRLEHHGFSLGAIGSVQFTVNTIAAALASTLGILMALVLLTVQLSAQRFSFNIVDLFLPSKVNLGMILLFIVSIDYSLWISVLIDDDYIPETASYLALVLATVCFSLIIPYTLYLFKVLRPSNLLDTLRQDVLKAAQKSRREGDIATCHHLASQRLENIGDVGRSAVNLADADTARRAIWALHGTINDYLDLKPHLPKAWFEAESRIVRGRHSAALQQIRSNGLWIERRAIEELQDLFNAALLTRMDDITHTVARALHEVGEAALKYGDRPLMQLVSKFFNTFLRATINRGEVRGGYDTLYEYELLAESALQREPTYAIQIAERLAYYGEAAGGRLHWMAAASAHDLRILAETNHRRQGNPEVTYRFIQILAGMVGHVAPRDPVLGRQLYKSVTTLGCYFHTVGEEETSDVVRAILREVPDTELARLEEELAAVDEPEFWEVTERWVNFDYMEPELRHALGPFLSDAKSDSRNRPPAVLLEESSSGTVLL